MSYIFIYMYWFLVFDGTDFNNIGRFNTLQECQSYRQAIVRLVRRGDTEVFYVAPCEQREFRVTVADEKPA
jgi:hypothetical protein